MKRSRTARLVITALVVCFVSLLQPRFVLLSQGRTDESLDRTVTASKVTTWTSDNHVYASTSFTVSGDGLVGDLYGTFPEQGIGKFIFDCPPKPVRGLYLGWRYEYRIDISYGVIFDGEPTLNQSATGISAANPNYGCPEMGLIVSASPTGVTLKTYVYRLWTLSGRYVGWYPTQTPQFSFTATGNVLPIVGAGPNQAVCESDTVSLAPATFTDPTDPGVLETHTATIDWGDGSPVEAGTVSESAGSGTVSGSHAYGDDGIYTIIVTVCDDKGACGEDSFTVAVSNKKPTVSATGDTMEEGGTAAVSASFTDPGWLDTHEALIDWGDGTPPEEVTVIQGAGSGSLAASHVYGDNGTYTPIITVTDDDGGVGTAAPVVQVNNVAPTASFANTSGTVFEGELATLTFSNESDPSTADTAAGFRYSYDCTDDGTFELAGDPAPSFECPYPSAGTFTARGIIEDKDGGSTDYTVVVTVLSPQGAADTVIDDVQDMVDTGTLNQGQGTALISKLDAAIAKLNQGKDKPAINLLRALINQVNDLIDTGVLTAKEGQPLIDTANRIIDSIG